MNYDIWMYLDKYCMFEIKRQHQFLASFPGGNATEGLRKSCTPQGFLAAFSMCFFPM